MLQSECKIALTFATELIQTDKQQKKYMKMKLEHLTNETFKEKIFNYENNKEWKFEGKYSGHHRFLC